MIDRSSPMGGAQWKDRSISEGGQREIVMEKVMQKQPRSTVSRVGVFEGKPP